MTRHADTYRGRRRNVFKVACIVEKLSWRYWAEWNRDYLARTPRRKGKR